MLRNILLKTVVYRSFPTSNHNTPYSDVCKRLVVYRSFPTSNHNACAFHLASTRVVYRSFPTSNHNVNVLICDIHMLYIVRFLHQTTTVLQDKRNEDRLYIVRFLHQTTTHWSHFPHGTWLYIVRFLHQTTTLSVRSMLEASCISFVSYIKPQPHRHGYNIVICCISFVSYIKPQQRC